MTDIVEMLKKRDCKSLLDAYDVMEEAADEIERLRKALVYEENRFFRVGTHDPKCYTWGPSHYDCAMREIEQLRQRELVLRAALIQISQQDYGALRPNKCVHDRYYYEPCIDCASDVAMRGLVEAYDSGETE